MLGGMRDARREDKREEKSQEGGGMLGNFLLLLPFFLLS